MFNINDGKKAVIFAREVIESYIKKGVIISSDFKGIFEKRYWVSPLMDPSWNTIFSKIVQRINQYLRKFRVLDHKLDEIA